MVGVVTNKQTNTNNPWMKGYSQQHGLGIPYRNIGEGRVPYRCMSHWDSCINHKPTVAWVTTEKVCGLTAL